MNSLTKKRLSSYGNGFTLVEVLVGLTATLIVLLAMVQAFKFANIEMQKGRASLELTNRLRTTQSLLRDDLRRLTVEAKSYYNSASRPKGYLEIADGPKVDINNLADEADPALPTVNESATSLTVGDYDDIFAGTIRSEGRPFRGRGPNGSVVQSPLAEVIWFTTFDDADADGFAEPIDGDQIRLFRRQLVISPGTDLTPAGPVLTIDLANQILQNTDVSARVVAVAGPAFDVIANSLSDLEFRQNRFCHNQTIFPQTSTFDLALMQGDPQYNNVPPTFSHRRASNQNDLMLTGVAAFDIRVFEPEALSLVKHVNRNGTGVGLPDIVLDHSEPSDVGTRVSILTGFNTDVFGDSSGGNVDTMIEENGSTENGSLITVTGLNRVGAYVDLGKTGVAGTFGAFPATTPELFVGSGSTRTVLRAGLAFSDVFTWLPNGATVASSLPMAIFETGTPDYNRLNGNRFGANGINDDPTEDATVDSDERLVPPYANRIRGLKFTIRLYEPNSGQVRQMTIKQSMMPK